VIDGIFSTLSSSTFLTLHHFSLYKCITGFTDQALLIHCPAKNFLTTWYILLPHSALEYNQGEDYAVLNFHVVVVVVIVAVVLIVVNIIVIIAAVIFIIICLTNSCLA